MDKICKSRAGKALSISGINKRVAEEFKRYAKDNKLEQHKLQSMLWNNFNNFYVEFSEEEQATIDKARQLSGANFKRKVQKAVLKIAGNVIEANSLVSNVDETIKNSAQAADARVDHIVNTMMRDNELATAWYNKVFISKKSIFEYAKEYKEQNPDSYSVGKAVIDRYLKSNKDFVQKHNEEQGLQANHNLKAHYERIKQTKYSKEE